MSTVKKSLANIRKIVKRRHEEEERIRLEAETQERLLREEEERIQKELIENEKLKAEKSQKKKEKYNS
jgi:hypothetical protein